MAHTRGALGGCSSHCFECEELLASYSAVAQPFHQYGEAYSFLGSAGSHLITPPPLHDRKGSLFPGCLPPDDVVDPASVGGIKPGDSDVVLVVRLMNVLTLGWQDVSLLKHTLTLVSWARYQH